jgi:hypothetical protein
VADVFPPTKKAAIGSICDASLEMLLGRKREVGSSHLFMAVRQAIYRSGAPA